MKPTKLLYLLSRLLEFESRGWLQYPVQYREAYLGRQEKTRKNTWRSCFWEPGKCLVDGSESGGFLVTGFIYFYPRTFGTHLAKTPSMALAHCHLLLKYCIAIFSPRLNAKVVPNLHISGSPETEVFLLTQAAENQFSDSVGILPRRIHGLSTSSFHK